MTTPRILAFDTSGAACSAALLIADKVELRVDQMKRGQAEHLVPMLEEMLACHGTTWSDLDGIGVGTGPGNFTGIRISVSAARGMALGLGIPVVGVSILEAQVDGMLEGAPVVSVVDARQGRFYAQVIDGRSARPPQHCAAGALPDGLAVGSHRFVGVGPDISLPSGVALQQPDHPAVIGIARIAARRFATENKRPAPLYLRPADAASAKDAAPILLT